MATRIVGLGPKAGVLKYDTDVHQNFFTFSDKIGDSSNWFLAGVGGLIDLLNILDAGGAPIDGEYIVSALTGDLTAERLLQGTANQITVTFGASSATLSTPQNIHTAATPTFASLTLSGMSAAGFVKNSAAGVLSGGYGAGGSGLVDISADTNLAVTAPIVLTGDTVSIAHNTTNMKVTSSQINTIQDIATSSSPQFTDLTLTGGDLICATATTFNCINTVATTVNAFGAAATLTIGALTGTATIRNAGVTLSFMNVAGFVKTTSGGVLSGGNTVDISADTNLTVSAPIILTGDTLSFGHNTTNLKITASQLDTIQGISTAASPTFTDMTLSGGDLICSTATTFNLINTVATTLNLGGAATTMTVGATTGTMTLRNSTIAVTNAATVGTDLTVSGDIYLGDRIDATGAGSGNYLDMNALAATFQLSTIASMQIVIESDAGAAGTFSITHGSLGDMMSISASADVVFSLGNLYARSYAGQNETSTSTTYTLTADSHVFFGAKTTAGTQTVTLPAANARGGGSQVIYVIKTVAGAPSTMQVTTPTGADTINLVDPGTVTLTTSRLNMFVSNGVSNWAHSEM